MRDTVFIAQAERQIKIELSEKIFLFRQSLKTGELCKARFTLHYYKYGKIVYCASHSSIKWIKISPLLYCLSIIYYVQLLVLLT
ncbi:hypothetical protein ADM90_09215 [Lysinibacillus macroides]|uniref:Uncharacterized protein n=1 Tax=Lysinibacillus macroides TaxID=33935 RepID=A0A0M9DLN8_9BACI|nr:hypothetical protein ADM90_09215 [Lysinibacillus macroides]